MKGKLMIIVLVVLLAAGAGAYFFLFSGKDEKGPETEKPKDPKEEYVSDEWNPYASSKNFQVTLQDFLLSAVNGKYVTKMTITVKFKDMESMDKFNGEKTPTYLNKEGEKEEGEVKEEGKLTPMNIEINSAINTYMLQANEETILNKEKLEKELTTYLNTKLNLGEDFISKIYIENYIIQ